MHATGQVAAPRAARSTTSTLALAIGVAVLSAGGCEGSTQDDTAGKRAAPEPTAGEETGNGERAAQQTAQDEAAGPPASRSAPEKASESRHAAWDAIVSSYATDDGGFRYEALRESTEDLARLDGYLERVAGADASTLERDAELAFYINAYNALTVKAVLDAWPTESVMEVDGFFKEKKHAVAGREVTLDELEHGIIREQFDEPRIHFAVNCASASCPPLADEAYTAANLERLLAAQTRAYVRESTEIDEGAGKVRVSKLFEWFEEDFADAGGVRAFVAERLPEGKAKKVRSDDLELVHREYDWALNDRP
ncbi:MAG: DUF547 domain-containing protein [Polyangiales bacterium]